MLITQTIRPQDRRLGLNDLPERVTGLAATSPVHRMSRATLASSKFITILSQNPHSAGITSYKTRSKTDFALYLAAGLFRA
ncbi:hypothetical protein [Polaromonas sp. DSR2-3-2]|uniref:hypothetical protein n=1 Tax=unclassified Polaromonas TaxID=2638319 RepID=UPI003CF5672D